MSRENFQFKSYHISNSPPNEHWPNGAWSLYAITGDQIADRIIREKINPNGYYEGEITHRHSWPGYIGLFESLDEVKFAIMENIKPQGFSKVTTKADLIKKGFNPHENMKIETKDA